MSADRRKAVERLVARSRELLEDMSSARQDLLSVADMNRAMQQILRNQVTILEALARRPAPRPTEPPPEPPQISLRPRPPNSEEERPPGGFDQLPVADEADDPIHRDYSAVAPLDTNELESMIDQLSPNGVRADLRSGAAKRSSPVTGSTAGKVAAEVLNEERVLPRPLARVFVEQFDKQHQEYDKGLSKLNRWVAGGSNGTTFQLRGDRAYLNLSGGSPSWLKKNEEQLMTRMGFSRRLGRLEVPGLEGEIVVYQRP